MPGTGWAGVGRVALAGIAGGAIAEIGGGSFGHGAAFAGTVAGADFVYRAILATQRNSQGQPFERKASSKTATNPAQSKSLTVALTDDLEAAQTGFATTKTNQGGFFDFSEKGGVTQWAARNIPLVHGTSLFHDAVTTDFRQLLGGGTFSRVVNGLFFNFPSMSPSFAITTLGTTFNEQPSLIGQFEIYGRK